MDAAAGAAGELPRRGWGAIDNWRDLFEWHGEHVVQDEGQPLGGGRPLQDDEQGQADRIRKEGFLLRVVLGRPTGQRSGEVCVERFLAP
jgi:hypothetical protein